MVRNHGQNPIRIEHLKGAVKAGRELPHFVINGNAQGLECASGDVPLATDRHWHNALHGRTQFASGLGQTLDD
jgi:hypothetical protein